MFNHNESFYKDRYWRNIAVAAPVLFRPYKPSFPDAVQETSFFDVRVYKAEQDETVIAEILLLNQMLTRQARAALWTEFVFSPDTISSIESFPAIIASLVLSPGDAIVGQVHAKLYNTGETPRMFDSLLINSMRQFGYRFD